MGIHYAEINQRGNNSSCFLSNYTEINLRGNKSNTRAYKLPKYKKAFHNTFQLKYAYYFLVKFHSKLLPLHELN